MLIAFFYHPHFASSVIIKSNCLWANHNSKQSLMRLIFMIMNKKRKTIPVTMTKKLLNLQS